VVFALGGKHTCLVACWHTHACASPDKNTTVPTSKVPRGFRRTEFSQNRTRCEGLATKGPSKMCIQVVGISFGCFGFPGLFGVPSPTEGRWDYGRASFLPVHAAANPSFGRLVAWFRRKAWKVTVFPQCEVEMLHPFFSFSGLFPFFLAVLSFRFRTEAPFSPCTHFNRAPPPCAPAISELPASRYAHWGSDHPVLTSGPPVRNGWNAAKRLQPPIKSNLAWRSGCTSLDFDCSLTRVLVGAGECSPSRVQSTQRPKYHP